MAYTETRTTSHRDRMGKSLMICLMGPVVIVLAILALWDNEKNAVNTTRALEEGQACTVELPDVSRVDAAYEGKLIHAVGRAETADVLCDEELGIRYNGIRLERRVQYYQWVEYSESETEINDDGSETTTTTYTYEREWADNPVDSCHFKESGHENTVSLHLPSEYRVARNVSLGAYTLSESQVERIGNRKAYGMEGYAIPDALEGRAGVQGNYLYVGSADTAACTVNPAAPRIGDVRITWSVISPCETLSIVARQRGSTFEPYVAVNGGHSVSLLGMGVQSAEQLYRAAHDSNTRETWHNRLEQSGLVILGYAMLFYPLIVLGDALSVFGKCMGLAALALAVVLGAGTAMATIAVAWLYYRPVFTCILLGAVAVSVWLVVRRYRTAGE